MMRKFTKDELDLIYELIGFDEEILWRSKARLIPNYTILTTLLLFVLALFSFIIIAALHPNRETWYLISLMVITLGVIGFTLYYSYRYYITNKDLFYIITSKRLIIFNSKDNVIQYEMLLSMIRILRIKKTIFNTASVIFDVDLSNDRLKEVGFMNIDDAEKVLNIIKSRVNHLKMD